MQIRIANRQDESKIREFAESVSANREKPFDLKGFDNDLVHIEANYFGQQGVFLVADENGEIIACAGARCKSDQVLLISRLLVREGESSREQIESEMLDVIVSFAPRMLYSGIECSEAFFSNVDLLRERGFEQKQGSLVLSVEPDL
ncbi:MAG: hypothetical protein K8F91_21360 [Candidatus Obscuribacterales bacterium]|nr:hypothetical protein [Candidatus Obscuribacterales bacterium]